MRNNADVLEQILPPSADLESRITSYLGRLKEEVSDCLEDHSFDSFIEEAANWLETEGGEGDTCSNQEYVDYLKQQSDESHYFPLRRALRYLLRARSANAQGLRDLAWGDLVNGADWSVCAMHELLQRRNTAQYTWREVAKKGGTQKGVRAQAQYQRVAVVIDELAPADGWANRRLAIKAVLSDVFERLNKEYGYDLHPDKRQTRLNQWYRDHEVVQAAIDRHLRAR